MEKYEQLSIVGEGSYGLVMKCRHKETEQIVAVKKFLETEEDATIRKMALREIRMLKRLKHENLVTMIEVFRHRKRFYLVFEYLEGTVLDELDKMPGGLGEERSRERIFQVTRGISYCHSNQIIHRDVKPENVLVSSLGVVKLCDFGFARMVSSSGEVCTEYVATRWYRAPELLVGEPTYGQPIDIWAIGCLFAEMLTGDPLFPGESDIDQLHLIVKLLGKPCSRHEHLMSKNTQLKAAAKLPEPARPAEASLRDRFPAWPAAAVDFLAGCAKMDPQLRLTADELLRHPYFRHDAFPQRFLPALREKVGFELDSPLLRKFKTEILMASDKRDETRRRSRDSKWRFTLSEGTMKRKLSQDVAAFESFSERNIITLANSTQRLHVLQKNGQTQTLLGSKEKPGKSIAVDIQMLEKSLESLAKSNRQGDGHKEENEDSPIAGNYEFGDTNRSPVVHSVLHPSINNISFTRAPLKKSPNILHNINNNGAKPNQVPLLSNTRGQFLKKLERNVAENIFATGDPARHVFDSSAPTWLNNFNTSLYRKKEMRSRGDDFSLPNLPGATASLSRRKKRSSPEKHMDHSNEITPTYRYMRTKRKRNTLDISLPCLVKETDFVI